MAVKYLREQRHQGAVNEIARVKFPYPSKESPELDTLVNIPKPLISVGQVDGKDLYPDIVVVRRPGQWLMLMAQVETVDTLTDETALTRWLPVSKVGDLLIYVPFGYAKEAKDLCKKHGIKPKGIRLWRFRPVWGLDVSNA